MHVMILAAGRGERMRPLTDHTPKPLLMAGGKPLIVWHLERLATAGFVEVVINHAHLGEQIEAALGNGSRWGLSIRYSVEKVALETAGGIANALSLLGENPFLVVNGDIYTEMDFSPLKNALQPNKHAHLVLVNNPPQHSNGDFGFDNEVLTLDGGRRLTFSGVGVYHPALFSGVVRGSSAKLAPLLHTAINNQQASAERYTGIWHDVGTPQRLQDLDKELKARYV
jgi:MurNAc alpha-1-phosphate uridylyltransferase